MQQSIHLAQDASRSATGNAIALYARPSAEFSARVANALRLFEEAAEKHESKAVLTTSLGAEDVVLMDLIGRHELAIRWLTLNTGKLHAETLALIPRLEARYGRAVIRVEPLQQDIVHFVARHGEFAVRNGVELRKACCAIRKVEPLERALGTCTAWVTGLRREQSSERAEVPFRSVGRSAGGRTKYSPLADWSWADVWHYIDSYGVLYNPLHDDFFPSIGCERCTRAVVLGEDFRSGRWWWETEHGKECGLHTSRAATFSGNAKGEA
jgi:phosphoadenosine phosphosulfate reductase